MNEKYKNKYRIQSHRMPGWDYAGNGFYFITLVTQNRECNLGTIAIVDDVPTMVLSDFGKMVETEWHKSFEIRDELLLDEFQLMPNHLHAIVVLEKPNSGNYNDSIDTHNTHNTHDTHVETHGRASLQSSQSLQSSVQQSAAQFVRNPKSISSFVGGFKSAVNSKIDDYIDENNLDISKYNRNNRFFQPNYHDHIIRNENEYHRIKNYIINNPLNWNDDKLNPSNSGPEQ